MINDDISCFLYFSVIPSKKSRCFWLSDSGGLMQAAREQAQERPARSLPCWLFHITTYFLSWSKRESSPLTLVRPYNKKEPLSKFLNGKKGSWFNSVSYTFLPMSLLYAYCYFMSMTVRSFFKTFRRLMRDLSFEINSFTLDMPWASVILERVKSRIIFSDCLLASRKLFCTVCFPPPVGDFSSQRILVFNTYRSGVLLEDRRIKIRLLWKCCARSSAVSRSCWRGFEPPLSSYATLNFAITTLYYLRITGVKLARLDILGKWFTHSDVRDLSATPRRRRETGLDVTFDTKWREKNSRFLGGFSLYLHNFNDLCLAQNWIRSFNKTPYMTAGIHDICREL